MKMNLEQVYILCTDNFESEECRATEIYKLHLQDKLKMLKEIEKSKWMAYSSAHTILDMVTNINKELEKLQ